MPFASPRRHLRWAGNLLLVLLSIAAGGLACEGVARLVIAPRSSGIDLGILHARFRALHPVPAAGPASDSARSSAAARALFVGDSFTRGHGVDWAQSFPNVAASALGDAYAVENLGVDGADTRDETRRLAAAASQPGPPVALVVHQYFGNDIAYLIPPPQLPRRSWLDRRLIELSQVSYLVDYLYQPIYLASFGSTYVRGLFNAYGDESLFAAHRRDVDALWKTAHDAGGQVLFVIFPFLDNHVLRGAPLFDLSRKIYIAPLAAHFGRSCRTGDAILDVASLIAGQPEAGEMDHWIASRMDPHPSAALHALVAREIVRYMHGQPSRVARCPG